MGRLPYLVYLHFLFFPRPWRITVAYLLERTERCTRRMWERMSGG